MVNFSSLKLDELKLYFFWPFRVQTSKSNICLKLYKIKFANFLSFSPKKILFHKNLIKGMIYKNVKKSQHFLTSFGVPAVQLEKKIRKGAYAHFENKWGSSK